MKTASAKAKGRGLQKLVVGEILKAFPQLSPKDVTSTSMGASGIDIKLSEAARRIFPYATECKNQESISIWASWKQASDNGLDEGLEPLLVIKRNHSLPLVVLSLTEFIRIISNEKEQEAR